MLRFIIRFNNGKHYVIDRTWAILPRNITHAALDIWKEQSNGMFVALKNQTGTAWGCRLMTEKESLIMILSASQPDEFLDNLFRRPDYYTKSTGPK